MKHSKKKWRKTICALRLTAGCTYTSTRVEFVFRDSAVSHKVVSSLNLRCCTFFSIIPYQRSVLGWASVLTCLCSSHRSCALSFLKAASGQWGQQAEALPGPLKDPASQRLRNVAPPPPKEHASAACVGKIKKWARRKTNGCILGLRACTRAASDVCSTCAS